MECLEMYNSNNNSEHKGVPMSPRISFSTDFVEPNSGKQMGFISNQDRERDSSPISTDFEFSVSSSSLQLSADELFFKGKILPLKDHPFHKPTTTTTTTLRDELQSKHGDGNGISIKPPLKGRWKGFLGLRKSHIGSKKPDSNSHKLGMMKEEGGSSGADMEMKH